MATQAEVDAGLEVVNQYLDRIVSPWARPTVNEMLTDDVKFNLVLEVLNAAAKTRK
jgi:hypothetical protein